MNPLKVMVLGYKHEELPVLEKIMWIVKGVSSIGLTSKEHYIGCRKMMDKVDALVMKFPRSHLGFTEGVFLQMAYSISTPIFVVGVTDDTEFLEEMVTNQFSFTNELVDHLLANYC
jgi:hypothetical protein